MKKKRKPYEKKCRLVLDGVKYQNEPKQGVGVRLTVIPVAFMRSLLPIPDGVPPAFCGPPKRRSRW